MNKNINVIFFALILICVAGCSGFSMPDKAEISVDPKIEAGLGTKEIVLSEVFSKKDLEENFRKSGLDVFDYKPAGGDNEKTTFMALYRLFDIPIDIGSYIDNADLKDDFSTAIDDVSFTIPSIAVAGSTAAEIPSAIAAAKNAGLSVCAITKSEVFTINETTVALAKSDGSSAFESATIKNGTLNITMKLPEMKNVTKELKLTITQTGGLSIIDMVATETEHDGTYKLSLNGQTLDKDLNNVKVSGTFTVTPKVGASGSIATGIADSGILINITGNIESFKEISIAPTAAIPTEIPIKKTISLPKDFTDSVTSISFAPRPESPISDPELALYVTLSNPLPAVDGNGDANKITMEVKSTALHITASKDFPPGTGTPDTLNATADLKDQKLVPGDLTPDAVGRAQIDFDISVALPSDNGKIKLYDIAAGKTFTFESNIEFVARWTSVEVDGSKLATSGKFPKGKAIDTQTLFKLLPEGIKFNSIPVHIYIGGLDNTLVDKNTLKFPADISANIVSTDKGSASLSLFKDSIDFIDTVPEFNKDDFVYIGAEIPTYKGAAIPPASVEIDLADTINEKPQSIQLEYKITVGTFTIKNPGTEKVQAANLESLVMLELPMEIMIDGTDDFSGDPGIKIKLLTPENDLLGRDNPKEDSITGYLDYFESGTLAVTVDENTIGLETVLGYLIFGSESKELNLGVGVHSLPLTSDDIAFIKDNSFTPELGLFIPNTEAGKTITLNLDGQLGLSISGSILTRINETVRF